MEVQMTILLHKRAVLSIVHELRVAIRRVVLFIVVIQLVDQLRAQVTDSIARSDGFSETLPHRLTLLRFIRFPGWWNASRNNHSCIRHGLALLELLLLLFFFLLFSIVFTFIFGIIVTRFFIFLRLLIVLKLLLLRGRSALRRN